MARAACQPSPEKLKKKREAFVRVPMWWGEQVCKAARGSPQQVFVALWLLYRSWKAGAKTVSVPNAELRKLGNQSEDEAPCALRLRTGWST